MKPYVRTWVRGWLHAFVLAAVAVAAAPSDAEAQTRPAAGAEDRNSAAAVLELPGGPALHRLAAVEGCELVAPGAASPVAAACSLPRAVASRSLLLPCGLPRVLPALFEGFSYLTTGPPPRAR
jgi:hypothetical protein